MKEIHFHSDAEVEMIDAATHYEGQQKDLGKRFLHSVQEAIGRIQINPTLYPIIEFDVRRCLTYTFPYGILFRILANEIILVAIMHLHRKPDYWKKRRLD